MIGAFKLVKAVSLAFVGFGLLSLVHRDVAEVIDSLVNKLGMDPGNHLLHSLIERVTGIPRHTLRALGVGTLFYAALFLTEGVGLLLAKRWAEYMTLIITGSFLPLECYELLRHPSVVKALVVLVNAAVVVYLWRIVRSKPPPRENQPSTLPSSSRSGAR